MKNLSKINHLSKEDIIKQGSIYTPNYLVNLVYDLCKNIILETTFIADFGSGYGSFIKKFQNKGKRCFGTDIDNLSIKFLNQTFPNIEFYSENFLININRKKYGLKENDELLIIGNPPYNDVTSLVNKGKKGKIECDKSVLSRDLGISFLKAYDLLKAKYVCVLHPLSYLIKKQNFQSLKSFKENYKLKDAVIFSSKEFETIKKTNAEFPVVAAFYQKDSTGTTFEEISNFEFRIYNSEKIFKLNLINTIDNKINKYPKKELKTGLQFYTLRDMNALMRNTTFVENQKHNGIPVTLETLYQYSWLFFLKNVFRPEKEKYLYGNLSPLYTNKLDDKNFKRALVWYAYNFNDLIKKYFNEETLKKAYGPKTNEYAILYNELINLYYFN